MIFFNSPFVKIMQNVTKLQNTAHLSKKLETWTLNEMTAGSELNKIDSDLTKSLSAE